MVYLHGCFNENHEIVQKLGALLIFPFVFTLVIEGQLKAGHRVDQDSFQEMKVYLFEHLFL